MPGVCSGTGAVKYFLGGGGGGGGGGDDDAGAASKSQISRGFGGGYLHVSGLHAIKRAQQNILKKKKKYMEGGEEK